MKRSHLAKGYIRSVYTSVISTARVFKSGNSQAVRLPKEFRFSVDELEIFRRGDEVILREPTRSAVGIYHALRSLPEDFLVDGIGDRPPQKRKGL
jgi:antitoxin VapB